MKYAGKTYKVTVPKSRDPFVNTAVIQAGTDAVTGKERFWTTSYNANTGCTGVLVDEWGNAQIKKFGNPYYGFYSCNYDNNGKLWLWGLLDKICSYDPNTNEFIKYDTGGSGSLVFNGAPYDPITGRIFAAASTPPDSEGLVFDTKLKETVIRYKNHWIQKYLSNSFPNGDGTYTIVVTVPGIGFYRWDPVSLEVTPMQQFTPKEAENLDAGGRLVMNNHIYISGKGWYDPNANRFADGPRPEKEAVWLHYDAAVNGIYGCISQSSDNTLVFWDLQTDAVSPLYTIKSSSPKMVAFTQNSIAIAINWFGFFHRINLKERCLETSVRLDTDEYGRTDCIMRIDDNTLMGTPFITQRFWTVDLKTGKGTDCGRVASAGGQVNLTWNINGKVYMACYTSGELALYDPSLPVFYPENPCVTVYPPRPALRPVAGADDGVNIYYTCNNDYGMSGCMLVRYNTKTNQSGFAKDIFPGQQIRSMFYDSEDNILVGGTAPEGDCGSYIPDYYESYFVLIDPVGMTITLKRKAGEGARMASVIGLLGNQKALVRYHNETCIWDYKNDVFVPINPTEQAAVKMHGIVPTIKPGLFLMLRQTDLELWDMAKPVKLKTIAEDVAPCRVISDKKDIILYSGNTITVLDNVLEGYIE